MEQESAQQQESPSLEEDVRQGLLHVDSGGRSSGVADARKKKRKSEGADRDEDERSPDRNKRHSFQPDCEDDGECVRPKTSPGDTAPSQPQVGSSVPKKGATIRVTTGRHSGLIGVVSDVQEAALLVELPQPSRFQTVRVKSDEAEVTAYRPAKAVRRSVEAVQAFNSRNEENSVQWSATGNSPVAVLWSPSTSWRHPFSDTPRTSSPPKVISASTLDWMGSVAGGKGDERPERAEGGLFSPGTSTAGAATVVRTSGRSDGTCDGVVQASPEVIAKGGGGGLPLLGQDGAYLRAGEHEAGARFMVVQRRTTSTASLGCKAGAVGEEEEEGSISPARRRPIPHSDGTAAAWGNAAKTGHSESGKRDGGDHGHDISNSGLFRSNSNGTAGVLRRNSNRSSIRCSINSISSGDGLVDVDVGDDNIDGPSLHLLITRPGDAGRKAIPSVLGPVSRRDEGGGGDETHRDCRCPGTTVAASTSTKSADTLTSVGSSNASVDDGDVASSRCTGCVASEESSAQAVVVEPSTRNVDVACRPSIEALRPNDEQAECLVQVPAGSPRLVSPSVSADARSPTKNSELVTSCRVQDNSKSPIKSGRSSWQRPRPPGLTLGVDDVDTEVREGGLTKAAQVFENLWLSGEEVTRDKLSLQREGVTHIVNCSARLANFYPQDFKYHRVSWEDESGQDMDPPVLEAAFRHIDEARREGTACLVHCKAGTSRSCSLLLGYLMQLGEGMSLLAALEFCQAKRRQCNPDKYFLEKLSEYEQSLFGQTTVSLHGYHRGDTAGSLLII